MNTTWLLAGLLLTGAVRAGAAPLPPDSATVPHRQFSTALNYGSNLTYFGRTQSKAFPYLATSLVYTTKDGFYVSADFYHLLNNDRTLDETDLAVGWDHNFSETLDGSVSYSHFFFPTGSELVKSSVNNALDAALGQDWGPVYSRLTATYLYGKAASKGDIFLNLENSHNFKFLHIFSHKDALSIAPLVSLAAGTQSFVESVLTRRRGTKVTTSNRFSMVDYEFAVPLTYSLGKVAASAGWRYIIPVNLPAEDVESRALSVWTLGLTFTL